MHGSGLLLSLSHCLAAETGVYEQEVWNDVSFVGTVYLQLESVFHQLIGGVVARLCRARGSLLATDLIARNNRTRSLIFPYTSNITSVHVRVESMDDIGIFVFSPS